MIRAGPGESVHCTSSASRHFWSGMSDYSSVLFPHCEYMSECQIIDGKFHFDVLYIESLHTETPAIASVYLPQNPRIRGFKEPASVLRRSTSPLSARRTSHDTQPRPAVYSLAHTHAELNSSIPAHYGPEIARNGCVNRVRRQTTSPGRPRYPPTHSDSRRVRNDTTRLRQPFPTTTTSIRASAPGYSHHFHPPSSPPFDYATTTSNIVQNDNSEGRRAIGSEKIRCEDWHMGKSELNYHVIDTTTTATHHAHYPGHLQVPTPPPYPSTSRVCANEPSHAVYVRQSPADDYPALRHPKTRPREPPTPPTQPPRSPPWSVRLHERSHAISVRQNPADHHNTSPPWEARHPEPAPSRIPRLAPLLSRDCSNDTSRFVFDRQWSAVDAHALSGSKTRLHESSMPSPFPHLEYS
jgi:hypothetical protein